MCFKDTFGTLFDSEPDENTHYDNSTHADNVATSVKSQKRRFKKRFRAKFKSKLKDLNIRVSSVNIVENVITSLLENATTSETESVFRICLLIGEKLENVQLFNALNISSSRLVQTIMLSGPQADAFLDICFSSFCPETNDQVFFEWLPSSKVCSFLQTAQTVMNENIFWKFKKHLSTKSKNAVQNLFKNVYLERPDYPGVKEIETLCSALGAFTTHEKLALICLNFDGNMTLPYPVVEFLNNFDFYTLNSILICSFEFSPKKLCCPACYALHNVYCQKEMLDECTITTFLDFFNEYSELKHEAPDDKTVKVLREMVVKSINNEYLVKSLTNFFTQRQLGEIVIQMVDDFLEKFNKNTAASSIDELNMVLTFCSCFCNMHQDAHDLTNENFTKIQRFTRSAIIAKSGEDIAQIVFDDLLAIPLPEKNTWSYQSTEITKILNLAHRATKKVTPKGVELIQVYPLHRCVIATPVKLPGYNVVHFELDFFQYQIIELFNCSDIEDFQTIMNLFPEMWHAAVKAGLKRLIGIQLFKPILKGNNEALKLQLDKVSVPSSVFTYLLEPGQLVIKLCK